MNEKNFKAIQSAGIWSLVMGIVVLTAGVVSGVLMLINAARLLKIKSEMLF